MTTALISKVRTRMRPNTRWSGGMRSMSPLRVAPAGRPRRAGSRRSSASRSWRSPASTSASVQRASSAISCGLARQRRVGGVLRAAAPGRSSSPASGRPATSLFSRRARAPASELSGSARQVGRDGRERLGVGGVPSRFQPCERRHGARQGVGHLRVLDRALEQRARSAPGRSAAGTRSSGSVSANARSLRRRSARASAAQASGPRRARPSASSCRGSTAGVGAVAWRPTR